MSPRPFITSTEASHLSTVVIASFGSKPRLTHSGMNISRFFALHVMAALLPTAAGITMYGWRAAANIAIVVFSALLATAFWKRIGSRGHTLRRSSALWYSLLLALMLPAHLLSDSATFDAPRHLWAILPGAGILLTLVTWLVGSAGAGRLHPVLITYLLLAVAFSANMPARRVLQRQHLFTGDLYRSTPVSSYSHDGWINAVPLRDADALDVESPARRLTAYTTITEPHQQNWLSLDNLLRDELPPLEDLILGGQPGPLGTSCAIAVIVGGLFLLYRGVIDFRVPLFMIGTAMLAFLLLPIPLVVTETGVTWIGVAVTHPAVGPAKAITFACYEILAGPMLFTAFFLATSPSIRPMTRGARLIFGVLTGALAAALQLYLSVSIGSYVALLMVALIAPWLDHLFAPRTAY